MLGLNVLLSRFFGGLTSTYFVKTGGNDALDGLSDATAWETVAQVNGATFKTGDRIAFNRGNTFGTNLIVPRSGITITNYGSGGLPTLSNGLTMIGVDNVTIDGVESLAGGNWRGLKLSKCNNCTIKNSTFDGKNLTTSTIKVVIINDETDVAASASTNIIFDSNIVRYGGSLTGSPQFGGGINVGGAARNVSISNNVVYDNIETNIQAYSTNATVDTVVIVGNIHYGTYDLTSANYDNSINLGYRACNCIVEKNYGYNTKSGYAVDQLTSNSTIRNNIFYGNNSWGTLRVIDAGPTNGTVNVKIYNNTFIPTNVSGGVIGISVLNANNGTFNGVDIQNNIVIGNLANARLMNFNCTVTTLTCGYNVFYNGGNTAYYSWTNTWNTLANFKTLVSDTTSLGDGTDPLVTVSPTTFTISISSIAYTYGALALVTEDFYGTTRPVTVGVNVGAVEGTS